MTLGGLALAVGILVDNSTVTIENTHRLLTEEQHAAAAGDAARLGRHRRADAGLDARDLLRVHLGRVPAGPAKYLFTPLGLAVVFAMLASYGLSRTLTPITIGLLLKGERHGEPDDAQALAGSRAFMRAFERGFERDARRPTCALLRFAARRAS